MKGIRTAHSARVDSASVPAAGSPSPNTRSDRLITQKDSTGFDQKWSGSFGDPGQKRLM